MTEEKITVSVCMITYNHEPYIRQAIEGVLMQKCNFPIELIIGEDCSTDNTRHICNEYTAKYPEINLLPSEINLGVILNFFKTLQASTGKYIAICEGDDYWTDPYKLQKQVDFLEANTEYGLVHTDLSLIDINGCPIVDHDLITRMREFYKKKPSIDVFDLFEWNKIGTLTTCFRAELIAQLINESNEDELNYIYDYSIWLFIGAHSKIYRLNDKTAAYRVAENSFNQLGSEYNRHPWINEAKNRSEYHTLKILGYNDRLQTISNKEYSIISNVVWRLIKNKHYFTKNEQKYLKQIILHYNIIIIRQTINWIVKSIFRKIGKSFL